MQKKDWKKDLGKELQASQSDLSDGEGYRADCLDHHMACAGQPDKQVITEPDQ